jgi:hypothetical protein
MTIVLTLLLSFLPDAHAADEPVWWTNQRVAVAGYPSGLISDTRFQYRVPLHRSESIVFQDTYAGFGARVAATPAFTEVGPRLSLAPIDIFDIDLQASWVQYYGKGGIGLLPFEVPEGKLESQRKDRGEESVTSGAFSLTAAPTLKAKVGPVILLDGWTFSYVSVDPGGEHDAPFVYEPYRDLVIGWNDVTVEHQAALLYEALPGGEEPMLRVGATVRDRFAVESKDRSTTAGVIAMVRPGTKAAVPTLVGQALLYVKDADRVGAAPSLALLASWTLEHPNRK